MLLKTDLAAGLCSGDRAVLCSGFPKLSQITAVRRVPLLTSSFELGVLSFLPNERLLVEGFRRLIAGFGFRLLPRSFNLKDLEPETSEETSGQALPPILNEACVLRAPKN